jgi:phage shock protein A
MNIGDRFVRLVKSNVNELLSNLEDPEKVLEQAVADMQKDLVKVRQAYAEVSASSKRMEEQIRLAEAEAAKWYQRAQLAIEKSEDELAREALTRRKQQLEMADSLKEQVEAQQGSITSLYESMKELEAKMTEAKAKKDQIIARARTAKAATKVNDMLAGVGTGSSTAAFDRMSEKVEQLEATADVSKQLAASGSTGAGTSIDSQFKALESGSRVDDELAAMKASMLPASPVDDELAEMKRALSQEGEKKP